MCKETKDTTPLPTYGWEEIKKHATKSDRWLVIDGCVYDVTRWAKRHPGGERLIAHHAGQDATDAWVAFHKDHKAVGKYLKPMMIGVLKEGEAKENELIKDWRDLRSKAEDVGYFRASPIFFSLILLHIIALEVAAWFLLYTFGVSWLTLLAASILLVTAQAQAGWAQHDYGHLSVFNSSRWNHITHIFTINFLKGASSSWWNYRHYQHHAKPNRMSKDPDIRMDKLFVLGKVQPVEWGQKKKKGFFGLKFNFQHEYFFFIMPPLLMPLYFNYEIPYFLISRKLWNELFWMGSFFVRYCIMFHHFLGIWGSLCLYLWVRFLESHWFVWTTQMSHLPMDISHDQDEDWVTMQLKATCNVDPSFFNNWFSGHLNFQIEHHLFPTMPRHNLAKVAPLVRSLCKKHGIEYQSKSLLTAFSDIVGSLKDSGEMWVEAYNM
ncbi:hypothetical protein V1264_012987 [Littorina saxatilis]|uniref:Cytochrome b5 heme-binding domain-containing protein n=2 Tax=Littorina saxatilis TaxID=31220 RepID=A0AAN9BY88_9CAEN